MQLKNALLVVVAAFAAQGAAAQTCTAATFVESCNDDGTVQVCDTTAEGGPAEAALTCAEAIAPGAADASCAAPGCVGSCDDITVGCVADLGEKCIGFSPRTNETTADDNTAGSVLCSDGATCALTVEAGAAVDRCVAHVGPTCTPTSEPTCVGQVLSLCLQADDGSFAFTSNLAIDCSLFTDSACGVASCECDAQCGTGGTCTAGKCDGGDSCISTKPSTIVCPVAEGEGEGEGEGEDGGGGGGRRDDEPEPEAGCSSVNGASSSIAGLVLVLAALRRRRR